MGLTNLAAIASSSLQCVPRRELTEDQFDDGGWPAAFVEAFGVGLQLLLRIQALQSFLGKAKPDFGVRILTGSDRAREIAFRRAVVPFCVVRIAPIRVT